MTAPEHDFAAQAWTEAEAVLKGRLVALLPVGSTEAHGPHLPLSTDVIIAEGMARDAACKLKERGVAAHCLPTLPYGVTHCAEDFPGTITVSADSLRRFLADVTASLERQGVAVLCLVNAHLEPAHRHVLREIAEQAVGLRVVFPDKVRRHHAELLGDEFRSGACHAGSYESSLVMALRPDLVREDVRRGLAPNPISLGQALKDGKTTFREAGGPQAYFGFPAEASAEEGRRLLETLGIMVVEEVMAALEQAEGDR